jgi:PAS domain S-box-containing protein
VERGPVRAATSDRRLAVAGACVTAVLALVDALATGAVLIPLLVIGPMLAAASARTQATAIVALLAVAAAVPLGAADDIFGSSRHTIAIAAVAAVGLMATVAAALLQRERRARRRSELLGRSGKLLEAEQDPRAMLDAIASLAVPELADVCVVDLAGDDGRLHRAATAADESAAARALGDSRRRSTIEPDSAHPAAIVLRTGVPELLATLPEDVGARRAGSAVIAPLVARGRRLGVLSLLRIGHEAPYGDEDLAIGRELGLRAALALDNARLFAELGRTERRLETVLDNLGEAVTVQAADGRVVYVNDAFASLMGLDGAEAALQTPLAEMLARFVVLDEDGQPIEPDDYPGRRALRTGAPASTLMRNIDRESGEERWLLVKASPVRGEEGETRLVVNVIENVTEARRAARQERFLAAAGSLVSSSLDVGETLEKVAAAVVPELADWCCVDMPDERGELQRVAVAATGEGRRAALAHAPLAPAGPEARLLAGLASELGSRSVAGAPLTAGDRVVGFVTVGTDTSARRLGGAELALLAELGRRAGIAVENARVHAARTHIATTLQRSLLPPRLPEVPGLTLAARYRAAAATGGEVGGDFYDVFAVDGAWLAVIGDVTGKGPDAAAITSLARYTLRTAAMYERTPATVLARLNDTLHHDPERYLLCTALCVRLEPAADGIHARLASGGHPPAFLLRPGEGAHPIGRQGTLLGAFRDAYWPEADVVLDPGAALVLYTDGVLDAQGAEDRFGQDRLEAELDGLTGLPAEEIAARLDAAIRDFQKGAQRDDIALLVLRAE